VKACIPRYDGYSLHEDGNGQRSALVDASSIIYMFTGMTVVFRPRMWLRQAY
jgi:hypothetical protein